MINKYGILIRDNRDYKIWWEVLHEIQKLGEEFGLSDRKKDDIREIKVALREYNRNRPARKIGWGEYDYWTELYSLPVSDDWTLEEVTEWFEEWEVCHCYPSQYDCTGQIFTTSYKIFKRRGKWMCYHSYGMDV